MKLKVKPGKYVVAVSGGVDSAVLLDLLAENPKLELIVAHFDHGIRSDSTEDRQFVATLSQKYGLKFEFGEGKLGSQASEEEARRARYKYLQQIRKKYGATGVMTAHHQDDAVETLALNTLRGTRRKGMSSLKSTDRIYRPLLGYTKSEIINEARRRGLQWREDSTNVDEKYTRNWIRRKVLPKLSRKQRQKLATIYESARQRNETLDLAIKRQLKQLKVGESLQRQKLIMLPYIVACEVMAAWLADSGVKEVDRKRVHYLVVGVKTLAPGKQVSVSRDLDLIIDQDMISLAGKAAGFRYNRELHG